MRLAGRRAELPRRPHGRLGVALAGVRAHDGVRAHATLEGIGSVKLLQEGGVVSAANASQIAGGAAAVLIVNEAALKTHGLTPVARIHNLTVTGGHPVIMLDEPIAATRRALKKAKGALSSPVRAS